MQALSKVLFAFYLLLLVWLVLFKFSFNLAPAFEHQTRRFNFIPFADVSRNSLREPILNFVIFIPFGLLLSVNLKRASLRRKLAFVFIFSLAAEVIQFVLAIGVADTTDIITNTVGGFLGLLLYAVSKKYVDTGKLDRCIVVAGTIFLVICIFLLGILFSHNVRFRSAH